MSEEAQKRHSEAESAFNEGNFSLAEYKFTEAIALDPNNLDFRIGKAVSLERQGKLDDALREYDRLLELFPDYGTAWANKAVILCNLELFQEAVMCADNALRLNNKDSAAWDIKGLALEIQRKIDEAMECYDELIRLSPAQGWSRKGGLLLAESSDVEKAITCFEKALNLDDKNWMHDAWNGKGAVNFSLGLFEEAVNCFDTALAYHPINANVLNNKGIVLMFQGKFQEAEKCMKAASLLAPSYVDHIYYLGYLHLHQGKFEDALKWFEKALAKEKENNFAVQGKALIEYLTANPRPPTCPDPIGGKSLQKLNKFNQTELYFGRGKTLLIFGEIEEAHKSFEKCLELNPNYKAAAIEIEKIRQLRKKKEEVNVQLQNSASVG